MTAVVPGGGFNDSFSKLRERLSRVALNVLVWGPGKGREGFEKRLQVKSELQEAFPNAAIYFSEDQPIRDQLARTFGRVDDLRFYEQESFHLEACDLCVVLDMSQGAGEELAYMLRAKSAHKMLILTPQRLESSKGFPAALRKYENQVFFPEDEYTSCRVVERVLARAYHVALSKECFH